MLRFKFLVLLLLGIYKSLVAGVLIYPDQHFSSVKKCQEILLGLSIYPSEEKAKAIAVVSKALDYLNSNSQIRESDFSLLEEATMGRRWGMRSAGDWSRVKMRLSEFVSEFKAGTLIPEQVFLLEGKKEFEKLKVKSQIPRLFPVEKKLLLGGLGLYMGSLIPIPDISVLFSVLGTLFWGTELLFRPTIFVSINHQFKYDFVEFLVDCAKRNEDSNASPVVLSYFSELEGKVLDAVMIPGDDPQFALIVSKLNLK